MTTSNERPGGAERDAADICAKWGVEALTTEQRADLQRFCAAALRSAHQAPQPPTSAEVEALQQRLFADDGLDGDALAKHYGAVAADAIAALRAAHQAPIYRCTQTWCAWRGLTEQATHQAPQAPKDETRGSVAAVGAQPAEQGQPRREFPVGLLGHPMREFAPGKWESAIWPSEAAEQGEPPVFPPICIDPRLRDNEVAITGKDGRDYIYLVTPSGKWIPTDEALQDRPQPSPPQAEEK